MKKPAEQIATNFTAVGIGENEAQFAAHHELVFAGTQSARPHQATNSPSRVKSWMRWLLVSAT